MIPVTIFADKKVAVFGLGGSGLLTARALKAGGAHVIAWDDAPLKNEQANAAGIETANLADIDWSDIAALVLSPGVPLTHPTPHWTAQRATLEGVEIIGDIELFCRERAAQVSSLGLDCPLVAITGTNGKSTTTALTAHLIASAGRDVQMGGNIGTPVLALEPFAPGRHYVIEVSSYQIDLAPSLRPTVGVFINLSADHLDRHGTIENYAAIKTLVVAQVEQGGTAVVGVDDRWAREAADRVERAGRKVVRISVEGSLRDGYFAEGARIMRGTAGKSYPAVQLTGIGSLRGKHNAQNAACAVATCVALGIELPAIQKGLVSFPGLAHRMQSVARKTTASGHILYVNDSKATNADSTAKALASFPDIFWIAGGKPKSGGIESLSEFWPRIRKAYLIGEAAEDFAATLGGKVDHQIDGVLSKAVEAATRDAEASGLKEAVILLSPACASFDQYPNFEVRGKAFTDLVLATRGVTSLAPL